MSKSRRHSALRSSRRAPELKDRDFDHEISLIDQCDSLSPVSPSISADARSSTDQAPLGGHKLEPSESQRPLAATQEDESEPKDASPENGDASSTKPPELSPAERPSIVVQPATPMTPGRMGSKSKRLSKKPNSPQKKQKPEIEYDILWENQRGGFFCGLPLFSSAALGNLDPPAWTNSLHKPSPTDPQTAQVPDPSWEWKDPEWRINHDDTVGMDEEGWEYSFMFAKKFSWHRPRWWNSFVRRRAWIRYRIKKEIGYEKNGLMNASYFQVTPKKQRHRSPSRGSWSSRNRSRSTDAGSRHSCAFSEISAEEDEHDEDEDDNSSFVVPDEVLVVDELLFFLRNARIDREKLEAMEVYINTCEDELLPLQDHMHDIMGLFIFQASRKLLLTRLVRLLDELGGHVPEGKGKATGSAADRKRENLAAAIRHADEEVRRLEYWSDVKGMVEHGESVGGADSGNGWKQGWDGIDNSGAQGPVT